MKNPITLTVGDRTFKINLILFQGMSEATLTGYLDHIRKGDVMPTACPYSNVEFGDGNPACIMIDADGTLKFGAEGPMELRALDLERPYMLLSAAVGAMEDERRVLELAREAEVQRVSLETRLIVEGLQTIWSVDGRTVMTDGEIAGAMQRVLSLKGLPDNAFELYLQSQKAAVAQTEGTKPAGDDEATRRQNLLAAVTGKVVTLLTGDDEGKSVIHDTAVGLRVMDAVIAEFGVEGWQLFEESLTQALVARVDSLDRDLRSQPDSSSMGADELMAALEAQVLANATLAEPALKAWKISKGLLKPDVVAKPDDDAPKQDVIAETAAKPEQDAPAAQATTRGGTEPMVAVPDASAAAALKPAGETAPVTLVAAVAAEETAADQQQPTA